MNGLTIAGADLRLVERALFFEGGRIRIALHDCEGAILPDAPVRAALLRDELARVDRLTDQVGNAITADDVRGPTRPAQSDAELIRAGFDEAVRMRCMLCGSAVVGPSTSRDAGRRGAGR